MQNIGNHSFLRHGVSFYIRAEAMSQAGLASAWPATDQPSYVTRNTYSDNQSTIVWLMSISSTLIVVI